MKHRTSQLSLQVAACPVHGADILHQWWPVHCQIPLHQTLFLLSQWLEQVSLVVMWSVLVGDFWVSSLGVQKWNQHLVEEPSVFVQVFLPRHQLHFEDWTRVSWGPVFSAHNPYVLLELGYHCWVSYPWNVYHKWAVTELVPSPCDWLTLSRHLAWISLWEMGTISVQCTCTALRHGKPHGCHTIVDAILVWQWPCYHTGGHNTALSFWCQLYFSRNRQRGLLQDGTDIILHGVPTKRQFFFVCILLQQVAQYICGFHSLGQRSNYYCPGLKLILKGEVII